MTNIGFWRLPNGDSECRDEESGDVVHIPRRSGPGVYHLVASYDGAGVRVCENGSLVEEDS